MERTFRTIVDHIKTKPYDYMAYNDLTDLLYTWEREDAKKANAQVNGVLAMQTRVMQKCAEDRKVDEAEKYRNLIYKTLLFSARKNFDHFMQALEFDRPARERFYLPRKERLAPFVRYMQMMADDELDEVFLSCPPRVGKTTLATFFATWMLGRDPEKSNLYSSFSDTLTNSFYNGIMEVLGDPDTYKWGEIFNGEKVVNKSAREEWVDIGRAKKYHSLTCRSLYGTLNGATDCSGLLIADDLLSGIEEALNPDRLQTAWQHVDNNLLTRAKGKAKILWIGTRWSVADPIQKRIQVLQTSPEFSYHRYKIINIPALNEKDESNFDYKYGVGFDTNYYRARRASFEANNDMASWNAQYMGAPIEREGTLFRPDDFRYFIDTPIDQEPIRRFATIDPAFGGGDFVSAPMCHSYGRYENYIVDSVFDNRAKNMTLPKLARRLRDNAISIVQIEANKSTRSFAEELKRELDKINYHCAIITRPAPVDKAKEIRIFDKSSDIKEHYLFKDQRKRTKEYNQFMQNIFSFKLTGKNKHDDAPDSMAQLEDMRNKGETGGVEITRRPF